MESDILINEEEFLMGMSKIPTANVHLIVKSTSEIKDPKINFTFHDLFIWDGKSAFGFTVTPYKKYEIISGTAVFRNAEGEIKKMYPIKKFYPLFLVDTIKANRSLLNPTEKMFDKNNPIDDMKKCFSINAKILGSASRIRFDELIQMQTYIGKIERYNHSKYLKAYTKQYPQNKQSKVARIIKEFKDEYDLGR